MDLPVYDPVYGFLSPRRKKVRDIFVNNRKLTLEEIKQIASEFACSTSAVKADILSLVNGSVFHVGPAQKDRIIKRDKGICYICGNFAERPMIEHIIPARAGGKAIDSNLAVSCQSCNIKKRYADAEKYPEKYWE